MKDCIFCKIRDGEIPSPKLYEDDEVFVIRDINPRAKCHYLMIPKDHYAYLGDKNANGEVLGRALKKIADLAPSLGLSNGYRVIINQGADGGQEVMHLHIHILGGEKLPL